MSNKIKTQAKVADDIKWYEIIIRRINDKPVLQQTKNFAGQQLHGWASSNEICQLIAPLIFWGIGKQRENKLNWDAFKTQPNIKMEHSTKKS